MKADSSCACSAAVHEQPGKKTPCLVTPATDSHNEERLVDASKQREKRGRSPCPSLPRAQRSAGGRHQNKLVFFMMRRNSSSFTSPSRSASSIISWSSSSVMRSPSSFATRFKFLKDILPVSSSSKRRKALRISSFGSRFRILWVIIFKNSSYSMVPLPSSSTSEIIFWISSFLGSKPKAR